MQKLTLAAAVMACFTSGLVNAEDIKPDHEVSFNATVTSDYRYRGISQARLKPALQGGVDYVNNSNGIYAGTWLSTIKWTRDAGGDGHIEWDIYGGKRGELVKDISYDVGALRYVYPSNNLNPSANTTEIYGQLGYGPAYIKYSHSVTNLFGFADSKGSGYWDLGANLDAGNGFIVNLHAGHQTVEGSVAGLSNSRFSYTDWKIGVTRDFGFATGAVAIIGTNAEKASYASPGNGKFLGKNALVLSISKIF